MCYDFLLGVVDSEEADGEVVDTAGRYLNTLEGCDERRKYLRDSGSHVSKWLCVMLTVAN